ncbi:MAG: hypothetical protein KDE58_12835 [Caldilineaceae bacterium]|nr:hypothetical protein [Caldilineaceae bacterium]
MATYLAGALILYSLEFDSLELGRSFSLALSSMRLLSASATGAESNSSVSLFWQIVTVAQRLYNENGAVVDNHSKNIA